jgi:hypothetical protein
LNDKDLFLFDEAKVILDLCGGSGSWSAPYKENNYDVRIIDVKTTGDVRLTKYNENLKVYGILAAPPCTCFAISGAWVKRTNEEMIEALSIMDACLRLVYAYDPVFWAMENPVGTMVSYVGAPRLIFQPSDYGDPWTKKTLIWGKFNFPMPEKVRATEGSIVTTKLRDPAERAITPPGFAKKFFEANR